MKDLIILSPANQKFLDIDELFSLKTLILTIAFAGLAFASNWFSFLMLPLDGTLGFSVPPYRLSLLLLFVALGAAVTSNLASTLIIAIVGGVAYMNYANPNAPVVSPLALLVLTLTVGIYAGWIGTLRVSGKTHGFIFLAVSVITSIITLFASWRTEKEVGKYYSQGIPIAHGSSFGLFEIGITLTDILFIIALLILWILWFIKYLKPDVNIASTEKKKYAITGYVFMIIGVFLPMGTIAIMTRTFDYHTLQALGNGVNAGEVLRDVFIHQQSPTFAVTETISAYYVNLASINLILFGAFLRSFSLGEGNKKLIKQGSLSVYAAYIIGFVVFFLFGFKSIATILGTVNSYVLPPVAYPIYFTLITMTMAFLILFTLIIEAIWVTISKE